jgi:c-di-GMP-binding flagellar brake protein YcgR
MFSFTFWRRLMGQPAPAPQADCAVDDDRRFWARYPTDLRGNLQLAEERPKVLVNVRDLSLGGANLVVDNPIPVGQMLTLELPTDAEAQTVLACVVRATPEDGKWSLGCVFSRELSVVDLDRLGAQKARAGANDQRVWMRFECAVRAQIRSFSDPVDAPHAVQVLDISASGIGLLVPTPLQAGSLLTVDLLDQAGRKVCSILACIVHTKQRSDGSHAIGCNFIRELSEEELAALV